MDQDSTNNYNNKQATRTQIKIERQANKRQEKMSEKNRKKSKEGERTATESGILQSSVDSGSDFPFISNGKRGKSYTTYVNCFF